MNCECDKVSTKQAFCLILETELQIFVVHQFPSLGVKMTWNIGGNRNQFIELIKSLRHWKFVKTVPKTASDDLNDCSRSTIFIEQLKKV